MDDALAISLVAIVPTTYVVLLVAFFALCMAATWQGIAVSIEILYLDSYGVDTLPFYTDGQVCATSGIGMLDDLVSYQDLVSAKKTQAKIAHCGRCGKCSNIEDMALLEDNAEFMTQLATSCG